MKKDLDFFEDDFEFEESEQLCSQGFENVLVVKGEDGFSPTITEHTNTSTEYRLSITDKNGSFVTPNLKGGNVESGSGEGESEGENGATFTPSVSPEGVLSWTNDKGLENPEPVNIKGEKGADGYTPVKGVDYFTDEEIQEVTQQAADLVYNETIDASKVVFSEDVTTGYQVGNITLTNGSAVLYKKGVSLLQNLKDIYEKVVYPSITQPSVSITFSQAKAYEVGTAVNPTYSASFKSGSYQFGSTTSTSTSTGVTVNTWTITDTAGNKETKTVTNNNSITGSFATVFAKEGVSYSITAKASYGNGYMPIASDKSEYTAGQIKAGSKSATSGSITAYRNTFYGTLTAKSDITSDIVRGLTGKSGKTLANGNSFTVSIPVGALRVVIAYPSNLRDLTSIKDVNGLNAEILSGFTKFPNITVEGASTGYSREYKVYIQDYANANDKANTYTVTI